MYTVCKIFSIISLKNRRKCFCLGIVMLLGALLEAVGIGLILPFLSVMGDADFLIHHQSVAFLLGEIGVFSHSHMVMVGALGLLLFYSLKNGYLIWMTNLQFEFSLALQANYGKQIYANYLLKPYAYFLENNTAKLVHNTYNGPMYIFSQMLVSVFMLFSEIFTVGLIVAMLIFLDAFVAIVVSGFMFIIIYGVLKVFHRNISQLGELRNRYSTDMYQWVHQGVGAIKETKVLGREKSFYDAYSIACEKYCEAHKGFSFLSQLPRFVIETLVVGGLLLLIIGKMILGNAPGDIVPLLGVLALAAFRIMPCANRIIGNINAIKFYMPMFNELYEELTIICNRMNKGEVQTTFPMVDTALLFRKEIRIEHLSFCYSEGGKAVLDDVSFTIPKGSYVGVVGPSGAGKTTFVDLLLGLLYPTSGDIFVDGGSIYDDIRAWQRNLAYVPQEIYLIDGTVQENVALGFVGEQIDNRRVEKVLCMAELFGFIQELPDGVNTMVGERGVKLSGGQRQRIGIARALYSSPEVLVLDEATSALDNETEKSITDTILKLKGQITIISIAHRVSTLEACDFKLKFEDGKTAFL